MLRCREPDGGEGWRSKLQNESSFSPIKRLNAFQLFYESEFEVWGRVSCWRVLPEVAPLLFYSPPFPNFAAWKGDGEW